MTQEFHRFRGSTFDDAYTLMRRKLGDDAVVIRTTHVREGGVLGFLGKKLVELTASAPVARKEFPTRSLGAAERKYANTLSGNLAPAPRTVPPAAKENAPVGSDETVADSVAYFRQLVSEAQRRIASQPAPRPVESAEAAPSPVVPFKRPQPAPNMTDVLRREIADLRQLVEMLVAETPGANVPTEYASHYKMLLDAGVSRKIAAALLAAAVRDSDREVMRNPRVFAERLANEVQRQVRVTGGIAVTAGTCRRIALVGATGVGKTTNLAKLAARYAVRERMQVALITADTYRVAAPEQLRVFANIIGIPMTVVNDAKEMASAIAAFHSYDLVLIDTAGGSQFNKGQLRELREMLVAGDPHEIMLMLAANTQLDDQQQIVSNFAPLSPSSVFYSKLDETRRYGTLFSMSAECGLPISYLSVGQNVPDDLVLAQSDIVTELVLKGRSTRVGTLYGR
ncbi:MAG: flagellar biosynthesis protein FlhF [Candidatus Hydrogenedentes bacterium]|nr:flagellar biosynthesis protein FlhF [Candidatus Hydrogenedentota bacterium]